MNGPDLHPIALSKQSCHCRVLAESDHSWHGWSNRRETTRWKIEDHRIPLRDSSRQANDELSAVGKWDLPNVGEHHLGDRVRTNEGKRSNVNVRTALADG